MTLLRRLLLLTIHSQRKGLPVDERVSFPDIDQMIASMNRMFHQPVSSRLTNLGIGRADDFLRALKEEVKEFDQCLILNHETGQESIDMVGFADTCGDLLVYILSECCKMGIPIIQVVAAIIRSQESKLVDGKPIKAPCGTKWGKGPNFVGPEAAIEDLLQAVATKEDREDIESGKLSLYAYPAERRVLIPKADQE